MTGMNVCPLLSTPPQTVPEAVVLRFQQMQRYVGWTEEHAQRMRRIGPLLEPSFPALVRDFYSTIEREPEVRQVIRGGLAQIERLKGTLTSWLGQLFVGVYDRDYVQMRWRVGWRHVEIGLEQVFTNLAMSRLRDQLGAELEQRWTGRSAELHHCLRALNMLLDLDLAVIQDAYAAEFLSRQRHFERSRAEEAMRESEDRYRSLIEETHDLVQTVGPSGAILFVNRAWEQTLGYEPEEISGLYLKNVVHPESLAQFREHVANVMAGEAVRDVEARLLTKDGRAVEVIGNIVGRRVAGEIVFTQAILHDITSRKQAEEKARQSERLAVIGQTITGLAHESRNAFQRSQACLEMLALELEGQTEQLELVSRIQRALNHVYHLYEEVRDYAAPIKLDRQVCDLSHLWRDSWSHLELMRGQKQLDLHEEIHVRSLTCLADWFALGQVFRNILENAIAACPEPGHITIRAERAELDGRPAIRVSVLDNGPGLTAEARLKIFDPFFTTKTKGTGLGMAIARRIVEAHGGQLAVGPATDTGAEIMVTIPKGRA